MFCSTGCLWTAFPSPQQQGNSLTCKGLSISNELQQFFALENPIQDKSMLTSKSVKKNNNKIKIISYPHTFTRACPHTDIITVLTEGSVGFTTQSTGQNVTQLHLWANKRQQAWRECVCSVQPRTELITHQRPVIPPPVSPAPPLFSIYLWTIPLQTAVSKDKNGLIMIHFPKAFMQVEKQNWRSYFISKSFNTSKLWALLLLEGNSLSP